MSDLTEWLRGYTYNRTSRFHERMCQAAHEIDRLNIKLEDVRRCTKDRPLDGGSNQWENGWDAAMKHVLNRIDEELR